MLIHGLQKMTLLDYPEHVACTVFLAGCDLRCPYCHNFELVDGTAQPVMDEEELFFFLKKRQGLLDGVAITGGEPLMRPDIDVFMEKIRKMGYLIKLDTNGCHPERLSQLLERGLADYVAMDIKNSPTRYSVTSGVSNLNIDNIKESVRIIMNSAPDYEFRTTVVKELHNKESFVEIGKWIQGAKAYYLQQFVERDTVPDKALSSPSEEEMALFLETVREYVPSAKIRGI
ncbi:anaerobic ribonucleoside-triphosphate reductase activating protein [Butyrivibrio sp. FCS014]|uniref:anaerobic ribonucleoside-triphosphate reductase activating protein n=1 Tax=Butyrivibrio sp. FCS014 TaxID=1408304 RepID=UPI000466BCC3|nr:anaerobic ribonucleoside-triphosphate reductase activating protein [Butyrivibrio sp. FCS014]